MIASPVVRPVCCPCLTKKLTVIGTIGQTQGMTSASRPPRADASRNGTIPCRAFWATSLKTSADLTTWGPAEEFYETFLTHCPECPELFELDRFGNAHEIGDGTVPAGLEDKAWLAQANCPEIAIEVTEE